MNNADMPAMPIGEQIDTCHLNAPCNGLTKREHLAGLAMQGLITLTGSFGADEEITARRCLKMADALLAELEKVQQ
jgi:hypothetical protein